MPHGGLQYVSRSSEVNTRFQTASLSIAPRYAVLPPSNAPTRNGGQQSPVIFCTPVHHGRSSGLRSSICMPTWSFSASCQTKTQYQRPVVRSPPQLSMTSTNFDPSDTTKERRWSPRLKRRTYERLAASNGVNGHLATKVCEEVTEDSLNIPAIVKLSSPKFKESLQVVKYLLLP